MRCLFTLGCALLLSLVANEVRSQEKKEAPLVWRDVRSLGVEGQGWKALAGTFQRLPAPAEKQVRPAVWNLSRHSAGLAVRFRTDATTLSVRWSLLNKELALAHMPATGVSGVDLYIRDTTGKWRWLSVGQPTAIDNTSVLVQGLARGPVREFMLYLPLYNGLTSCEVGVHAGHQLLPPTDRPAHKKPIVFYGTSITQGASASRPGMVHTALLGRELDWPVINLGFSGNGTMDTELADLLGDIDASLYVVDCLPNLLANQVTERAAGFVERLRKKRPETPILLVEDRGYANAPFVDRVAQRNQTSRQALRKAWLEMTSRGVASLHYLEGDNLLGSDGEATVDSSHPTDLGFTRQAQAMIERVRYCLPEPARPRASLEAYPGRLSHRPGDRLDLHVSSASPTFRYRIIRKGAKDEEVFRGEGTARLYPIPAQVSSHGCDWPVALSLALPDHWRSGYYEVLLTGTKGESASCFFVLRSPNPGRNTSLLLCLSTNTYNAYTNWGGYSLYGYNGKNRVQGRRVSFQRPLQSQVANWELPFVQWAESAGYTLDYAVNNDLEEQPDLLQAYRLFLSVGHDEYWSSAMRDTVERFVGKGGNAAFFSGNTCCWQVRAEDQGKALVCYKQAYKADPMYASGQHRLLSTLWSHHLIRRSENLLTGVGFL
ncbi:MAG: N,N-dimethylformamidase beta subunit family domain-containing protein, partial [Gemmataceae bacterium]